MAPLTLEKNDDKISDKKSLMKGKKIKVKLMFRRINMAIFTGAGVAIITPFHEDGSINYDQLKKLVDYH